MNDLQAHPLIGRLVREFGATWLDEATLDAWAAGTGDRVLLLAGDPVQFPEGLDVAVVLPEIRRSLGASFAIGVVPRAAEDAVARRYGSQRWPSLVFLRDGRYVSTLPGMHDWDDYLRQVREALAAPASRAPTIGIPLVSAQPGGSACH